MEFKLLDGSKYFKLARLQNMPNRDIVALYQDLSVRVKCGIEPHGVFTEEDLPVIKELMKDIVYVE